MAALNEKEISIANNEASLLGLLMREGECYLEVGDILRPHMFHFPGNQILYEAISDVHNSSKSFDATILINHLVSKKLIDKIGVQNYKGVNYITFITENAGYSSEIDTYVKNILDQFKRDSLNKLLEKTKDLIEKQPDEVNKIISNLQLDLIDIDISQINSDYQRIGDVAKKIVHDIYSNINNETGVGLSLGFKELDELLLGVNPGDLIILAARPAMGKTAFALNIANTVAKAGKTVLFFSLEMSNMQLVQRMLAIESLIPISLLKKNMLTNDERNCLNWAISDIEKWNIHLSNDESLTISDIITLSRRFAANNKKIDLLIVDYLQLITDSSLRGSENRQNEVSKISRGLKKLARELNCPILSLAQLSRSVERREDKTPILSDLRESGSIENDADAVLFLHRPDYYNKQKNVNESANGNSFDNERPFQNLSKTNVIVAKNRHGGTGVVELAFIPEYNKFADESTRENSQPLNFGKDAN
ncbi:replicative DNA helicase [Mycoplasma phocoeninasale]|uniref:Replicative DNA helicase n=1 Tax=Mycoplasma phocoeninasale TaxID=2726117 RepID=A0A858U5F7_9MOLU|nr:replicative DNA helicase [Mycoplasma phocoeninasale]MBN0970990.1 replicative DNA helicase [Mycoplasma phocoeninasale]QJG66483.1 replicative DNA helicase [Mycoplasma phocoeninasale]